MVEQNARRALAMASRAYLLSLGRIVGEGEAQMLARDSAVARSYLGLYDDRPAVLPAQRGPMVPHTPSTYGSPLAPGRQCI